MTVGNVLFYTLFAGYDEFISPLTVPAILTGPMDVTLEYSDDDLTATFTCTAFGGDGAMLDFTWFAVDSPAGLDTSSQRETLNPDNSTTSTITTNILTVDDSGSEYTCDVRYQSGSEVSDAMATLNIGKYIITYVYIFKIYCYVLLQFQQY